MPFGLTNVPASFQNFINDNLAPFLDKFMAAYLEHILIYLDDLIQKQKYVRRVVKKLQKAVLYLKTEKCGFSQAEGTYL